MHLDPGAAERAQVERSIDNEVSGNRAELLTQLREAAGKADTAEETKRANDLVSLVKDIGELSYPHYRSYLGHLSSIRETVMSQRRESSGHTEALASFQGEIDRFVDSAKGLTVLSRIADKISELYDETLRPPGADLANFNLHERASVTADKSYRFIESIVLLSRAVSSKGVNVSQPSWDPEKGETSMKADRWHKYALSNDKGQDLGYGHIEIRPAKPEDGPGVRVKFVPRNEHWDQSGEAVHVPVGKSISIGRPGLSIGGRASSQLGVQIEGLSIEMDLPIKAHNTSLWSRGAFRLTAFENREGETRFIISDHGTRMPLTQELNDGRGLTYVPKTIVFDNKRDLDGFGDSIFTQRF